MYLKTIEIVGFKSFADKTRIELKPGITGVIGPNGCGKSNIMEAVRWCIGEMSWKSLRSDSMVNVIFAGTSRRNPLSLAEVTLTFDNAKSMLPVQYSEVSVTRRIFRSGESEYWMNRTQCRLRDIRELFLDTGIGSDGYAIIDQGGVDFVMRAKPEERRSLFEEAAGVSKYKAKREEALRKLDRVQADLMRLLDSTGLIDQQIKKLEADARKAHLCQKYKTELSGLETRQIVEEAAWLAEETARKHEEAAPLLARAAELKIALEAEEGRLAALNLEKTHQEGSVIELNGRISAARADIQSLGSRREYAEQARNDASKELAASMPLLEAEKKKVAQMEPALAKARRDAEAAAQALQGLRARRDAFQSEFDKLQVSLELALKQSESLRSQALAAAGRQQEASRRESAAQTDFGRLEYQVRITLKTLEKRESDSSSLLEESARRRAAFEEQSLRIERAREALAALKEKREEGRRSAAEASAKEKALQEETVRLKAQIEALEIRGGSDPYWTGAQAACASGIPGVLGTVQSLLRAPEAARTLVEDALGDRLHAVLCETLSAAESAIRFLRDSGKGRARFLVLSSLPEREDSSSGLPPQAKPLLESLSFEPAHARAVRYLLAEAYSSEGALYGDHWVCGGSLDQAGGKPKLSDLESLRRALAQAGAGASALAEARSKTEAELSTLGQGVEAAGMGLIQEEARLDGIERERAQSEGLAHSLAEEASLLCGQAARELAGIADAKERILGLRVELAGCREEARHLEEAQAAAAAAVSELKERAAGRRADAENFADSLAMMENQERVLRENVEAQEVTRGSFEESARRRAQRHLEWTDRIDECTAAVAECKAGLDAAHRKLADFENEALGEETRLKAMRMDADRMDGSLREMRAEAGRVGAQAQSVELEISGLLARLESLRERLRAEWQLSLEEARERISAAAPAAAAEGDTGTAAAPSARGEGQRSGDGGPLAAASTKERVQWLRRRIEDLGNVNMGAPEEYEELKGKRDYLQGQMDDLNKAQEDLRSAIAKINATTREHFRQTFTEVREHFRRIYGVLFEGGEADLILTDQENMLETGVDIVAQPPGKRLQSISLLSGGEKALTAISLLFAFFMVRPSPMCMLDEADAALDEANVDRFAALLKEFTGKSQFLIVSHNKKTMEACDAIYGVTMEESGVSQLISVDFRKKAAESARTEGISSKSDDSSIERTTAS